MKFWMIIALICMVSAASAQTYRAGGSAQANFGAQEQAEEKEESSVPGARSNVQTRTFSNYSSRQQRDWSKGVQTQGVRTATAGSAEFVDNADAQAAKAAEALGVGQPKAAAQPTGKKAAKSAPGAQTASKSGKGAADAPQAAAQPAQDPAALLQQAQGMMQGMAAGAAGAAGGKTAGGAPTIPGMPAGMNVPGMPDVSALMNAAAAGQQPAKK